MKPGITVTEDRTDEILDVIKKFRNDSVLVGIPEGSGRQDDGSINNAMLLAINEFGSPMNNIPPRPVMAIGIRNAQEAIATQFKICAQNALSQGLTALRIYYERAGLIASNSVKKAINAQEGFDGPSKATLKAREAKGFKGTKSLIVTGQLRGAITYVVRGDD